MQTILALDYGLARIGVAIARQVALAEPLVVIHNDLKPASDSNLIGQQALAKLLEIIEQEKVDLLVIGVSERAMAEQILAFIDYLKTKIELPMVTVDETLSSYEVKQRLADLPSKKRHGPIDHYAAALILENYLEMC